MGTRKCAECGAEYTPNRAKQKYCSKRCANKVKRRGIARCREKSRVEQEKRECTLAHQCARLTPNEWIMKARRKPNGVSAVRWRIELRRRANAKYYAECGVAI